MKRLLLFFPFFLIGCAETVDNTPIVDDVVDDVVDYKANISTDDFVEMIDNPYFTLVPGKRWTYEMTSDLGVEKKEVLVTDRKKTINGIETMVVWEKDYLDGALVEDTRSWYAQDKDGNVWFFGEDEKMIEDGKLKEKSGWEAYLDGAEPGIAMLAAPKVNESRVHGYKKSEVEDYLEFLTLDEKVVTSVKEYEDCIKTREYSKLNTDADYKYFCKELGTLAMEMETDSELGLTLKMIEENIATVDFDVEYDLIEDNTDA